MIREEILSELEDMSNEELTAFRDEILRILRIRACAEAHPPTDQEED